MSKPKVSNENKTEEAEEEKIQINNSKSTDLLRLDIHSTDDNGVTRISVIAPTLKKKSKRLPVMICCVVDTSGSMGCDAIIKDANGKSESHGLSILDLVKHSIKTIIQCLNSKDYLSIIAYSNKAKIITNLIKMNKKHKKKTLNALQELQAEGQTNLWDGLFHGLEQFKQCKQDTFHNNSSIMLFTDGLPNIIPPKGHIAMLNEYIKQYKHAQLNTINTYGFGYSLDTNLLTQLAVAGHGNYSFIPDSTMVGTIFVNSISNFCCNVAKNAVLKVSVHKNYNGEIVGGYDCLLRENEIDINLGNIMYGQNKDIVIRFKLKDKNINEEKEGKNDELCHINADKSSLNYISLRDKKYMITRIIDWENTTNNKLAAEKLTKMSYCRLLSCGKLKECMKNMELDEMKESQNKLKDLIQEIEGHKLINGEEFVKDLLGDLRGQCFEAISSKENYTKWGKHYLPSLIFAHLHCFCNNFKDPGVQHYGGGLFNKLRDVANDIFIKMPAPKPSYKPPDWLKDFSGGDGGNMAARAQNVAMSSYMNASGGCFDPYCNVQMYDNSLAFVKDLVVGDMLANGAIIKCVIKYKCKNNKILLTTLYNYNKLKITPYHPIKIMNKWKFPIDINDNTTTEEECEYVYNFVLSSQHILIVNGIECCTLAHNFTESNVIKHEYFGTNKIIHDLKTFNGWKNGEIILNYDSFKRDPNSNLVYKLAQ